MSRSPVYQVPQHVDAGGPRIREYGIRRAFPSWPHGRPREVPTANKHEPTGEQHPSSVDDLNEFGYSSLTRTNGGAIWKNLVILQVSPRSSTRRCGGQRTAAR